LQRSEAACQRAAAARGWAEAVRERARTARGRSGYLLGQFDDWNGSEVRLPGRRELSGEERSLVRQSRRVTLALHTLTRHSEDLGQQALRLREQAADLADHMADEAEAFAAHLENSAGRGDADRRLAIARTEHEVARIEHQNAARLRDLSTRYESAEPLPKFPTSYV
jgi:hypothetical protein